MHKDVMDTATTRRATLGCFLGRWLTAISTGQQAGREYRCHACTSPVELKVARLCWYNKPAFGGNVYCRKRQGKVDV